VEAKENSSATLSCEFAPSPRVVRWFKGRTALKTSNKYGMKREGKRAELIIHGLLGMDAGHYHCMAGGAQSTAQVKVEGMFKSLISVFCTFWLPCDAELSCEITKPEATIHWRKNGHLIRQSPKYIMSVEKNLARLVIKNATIKDSGEYCCEAEGVASRAKLEIRGSCCFIWIFFFFWKTILYGSTNTFLIACQTLLFNPELQHTFVRELRDTRAEEKGKVTLECETRRPAKRVTWLKGMMELRSGKKYVIKQKGVVLSLTITYLEKLDTDIYICDVGTMQSRAQLTVHSKCMVHKVLILDELEDAECLEGETVTFRCRICPSDYLGVKWYLDETLLYTNELNEIQMVPGGNHTLTFRQLAHKDTVYSGALQLELMQLHVFTLPERRPTIIKALEDCEAIEGGGLVLSCVTSKPCHIIWYKDGCMMWHSSRYFTSRSDCEARLTIREVSNSDAGVYECSAGSVTTRAVVTVKVKSLLILVFFLAIPAEFTQLLKAVEAKEGEAVTLTCEYSLPGVQFHWRKGSESIRPGDKYVMKQRKTIILLTIKALSPHDSGEYTCQCRQHHTTATIPITFVQQLKNLQAEEGSSVILRCEISKPGIPVQWRKGHELLKNGVKHQMRKRETTLELLIWKPVPEDSGVYSCVCADQITSATVKITVLPVIFKQKLKNLQVEEGQNITLHCEISKAGVPVQWLKAAQVLSEEVSCGKYQIKFEGKKALMTIVNVQPEDAGKYSCITGDEKTTAEVRVKCKFKHMNICCFSNQSTTALPVTFKRELQSLVGKEGDSAVFCCELSKPEAPVEWRKGRVILKPGDKYEMKHEGRLTKLTIITVEESDAGKYTCKTKDRQSSAELTVKALPPSFKILLTDQEVMEGNSVVLHCELNKPASSVEWRKAGKLLRNGDKYQMRKKDLQVELKITDLTVEDTGDYACICGEQRTAAKISVNERLIKFLKKLKNIEVQEGNGVALCCELSKPGIPVEWRKEDIVLTSGEKYQMRQSGSKLELLIRKGLPEDSGTYSCICDDIKTTAAVIITEIPVTFKQKLKNQEVMEGDSAVFCCELSKPGAAVDWRKGRVILKPGYKYEMKQEGCFSKLIINNLEESDAGKYTCKTEDSQSTAELTVKERVRIVKELQDITVTAGEDAVFVCELSHSDVNQGMWWLASSPLQKNEMNQITYQGRQHCLVLKMTTTEETGTVEFVVGEERTSAHLLVIPKPKVLFEEKPRDTVVIERQTATLSCTTSDSTTLVTWRRNHVPLRNGDKYEMHKQGKVNLLLIHDVEPQDAGIYSCDTGDVQSSAMLTVTGN
uniref:Ig-like domain-containing protein n=1 Tax=Kryptolebias marmoratus TaxID=37003 RepID=A0A3Q3BIF6_KRYMA